MRPYTNLSGQGLAFVLRSTKDFSDAFLSQYLGLVNSTNYGNATNHLLAIELGTIMNNEFDDIDDNHIGIDNFSNYGNFSNHLLAIEVKKA
jgi:hypothetical protein